MFDRRKRIRFLATAKITTVRSKRATYSCISSIIDMVHIYLSNLNPTSANTINPHISTGPRLVIFKEIPPFVGIPFPTFTIMESSSKSRIQSASSPKNRPGTASNKCTKH